MLEIFKNPRCLILILFSLALFLRIINPLFPAFTSEEARIAYRAFTLSQTGRDELGRYWPFVFNSLKDYQLPLTSYVTSFGVIIMGKNDFGVRIPFIIVGIGLIFITYKISKVFRKERSFKIFSILTLIFSPLLIFLSRIPNDSIILTFLITLLFYLLTKKNQNIILIILIIILSLLVSKMSFFVLCPFVIYTLYFYNNSFSRKTKIKISLFCFLLTLVLGVYFLRIPQFKRGILENSFPIFSDITIKNGINRLRGQGIETGWPYFFEKFLFNKTHFIFVGFVHWLSNLSPSIYFGQFDKSGLYGFISMGAFSKILSIPFIMGIAYLINRGNKKEKLLFGYFIILTFPAFFIYPAYNFSSIVLTLPFMSLIIAFGLSGINKPLLIPLFLLMIFEIGPSLLYTSTEIKNTNDLRPNWIRAFTQDIYIFSKTQKVAVSEDIVKDDIVPFIEWYNPLSLTDHHNISFPYKFRQSDLVNIRIISSTNTFSTCGSNDYSKVILSTRDINKIKAESFKIDKVYKDILNNEKGFLLDRGLCISEL